MQKETILNIGFDDTDSPKGMCTTYLAYRLVDSLKKEKVEFLDYPRLIRFNPNIPWKTRGNGAVALKIKTSRPAVVKNKVIGFVKKFSDLKNGANPAVVFFENADIPEEFTQFSKHALWQLISRNNAKKFVADHNIESFYIGNGQGLVGAIGAIGYRFSDHTYELLSYRKKSQFGKKRKIVADSVRKMQEKTYPRTFNSYDTKKQKILFAPHGPDPVFFGIRGEDVGSLLDASQLIKTQEKPVGHMIFKSNQGTGDHLQNEIDVRSLRPYCSGMITGVVSVEPKMEKGGHVMFGIKKDGIEISCAVYKETGITKHATNLILGDKIRVGGGVRRASSKHNRVLNVEFFQVLRLEKKIILVNPTCTKCKKHMKSKGKGQGFECIKCGNKSPKKEIKQISRQIKKQIYIPQASAHRHLTRPQQRLETTNKELRFDEKAPWFSVY
ncbi:tRNA(Ile)(2)-agmatinylcytidine synthase [Candidatus Nitrosotenuis chungbukensis]|uniref:tRNA(Ile)(2)-agmatinylcytidine synthase n=1 Tax=Candidatus Nitrosotenuis chungbukensis TaxID=1353246 RepID=UPI0005B255D7|nr:tRNA(Ile)(2)-agmatinylcytidine synthase [Candidatus Nitrosotenuis chungbukensis]